MRHLETMPVPGAESVCSTGAKCLDIWRAPQSKQEEGGWFRGAPLVHAYLIWRFLGPWKGQGSGKGVFPLCPWMIPECR